MADHTQGKCAPTYAIPARRLAAVEHPMIIQDVDQAVKTFGPNADFNTVSPGTLLPERLPESELGRSFKKRTHKDSHPAQILAAESPQISVPLYLRPDNPTTRPTLSFNASTHNVVLKVVVPKRTGRKRKRGSDEAFEGPETRARNQQTSSVVQDAPGLLRRKLADNIGKYSVEIVGMIKNTHRYRGRLPRAGQVPVACQL